MTNLVTRLRDFPGGVGAEALCREAANEIERLNRYIQIVESYLDRETLKEVLTKYRSSPDGKAHEPRADAEDRAYCAGAQQAAAMAHQSLQAMDKWIAGGCGNRRAAVEPKPDTAEPIICDRCGQNIAGRMVHECDGIL